MCITAEAGIYFLYLKKIRHLVVTSGWTRDDDQFKRLDLSCARSLTVFGKWSSCFISPSMKLLRVLDLEEVDGLVEHHDLEHIGEAGISSIWV